MARFITVPLRNGRRGATALVFGLAAAPVAIGIAVAIDYSSASAAKTRLDAAANAAVLAATIAASNVFAQNPLAELTPAATAAVNRFNAQAGQIAGVAVQQPAVTVTRNGGTFNAALSYNATYSTLFAGLVHTAQVPITGQAQSAITAGSYVDMQVIMDVSSSMLIAATPTDIQNLINVTAKGKYASPASSWWSSGCAFACHWDPKNNDFYHAARTNKITLRMDQLTSAVSDIVSTMSAKNNLSLYRFGLYTFANNISVNYALSSNIAGAQAVVSGITPALANPNAAYNTDINGSLASFNKTYLATAGDGGTAATPKKYVFILTDGVEDVYAAGHSSNRIESAMDPSNCAAMRAKGATVAVLHTVYYNPNNEFSEISAIQNSVTAALQACASSPNLYFEVTDQAGINGAVNALLNIAIATPAKLTR